MTPPASVTRRLTALLLAGGGALALSGCGAKEHLDWAVVGSGPGGKTLLVQPVKQLGSCDETAIDMRESNANEVELAVTVETTSETCNSAAHTAEPIEVELRQPLRGQKISGPGLRPPAEAPEAKTNPTVPSVVGFNVPDARAILEARGAEAEITTGPSGAETEVTQQSPVAGATARSDNGDAEGSYRAIVQLRTVPR